MPSARFQPFLYDTIDSTNEEAKRLFTSGAISQAPFSHPAYVLSYAQTQGRGTQGSKWLSPAGAGLYLTVVHTALPDQPLLLTDVYTRAAGLACLQTLEELFNLRISLKPVNDLYLRCPQTDRYKKLGGILVESIVQENSLKAIMTGVGINILAVERPVDLAASRHPDIIPISLEEVLDAPKVMQVRDPLRRQELVETLVANIDAYYASLMPGETESLLERYRSVCITL